MKSAEIKAHMLWHSLYRLHHVAAITENGYGCIGVADVFAMTESGHTVEFEVKTAKADLMGEIKSIRALVEDTDIAGLFDKTKKPVHVAKYPKHSTYLKGSKTYTDEMMGSLEMRPNRFFFVVPEELAVAAREGLAGTPYGLYVVDQHGNCTNKKRADLLHEAKASDRLKLKILHSACVEVQVLRGRVAEGLKCTACRSSLETKCDPCKEKERKSRDYNRKTSACWKRVEESGLNFGDPRRSELYKTCMEETI